MSAFALGEIESPGGAYALSSVLKNTSAPGRARAVEALGKITAALANSAPAPTDQSAATKTEDDRLDILKQQFWTSSGLKPNVVRRRIA